MSGRVKGRRKLWAWAWTLALLAAGGRTLLAGLRVIRGVIGGETASVAGGGLELALFVVLLWLGVALAWQWPSPGAVVLLVEGVAMAVIVGVRALAFYVPAGELLTTIVTAALLPVAAGTLLVASVRGKPVSAKEA